MVTLDGHGKAGGQGGEMEDTGQLMLLLAPVALLQLGLMAFALADLVRRERTRGPKWAWGLAVVLFGFLGPIAYLLAGREE
jgi:hypothetical protein